MKMYEWKGREKTVTEIAAEEDVSYPTLASKVRKFKNIDRAVKAARAAKELRMARMKTPLPDDAPVIQLPKSEKEAAYSLFEQIMGMSKFDEMNFREGAKRGEYLWNGELVKYRLLMDRTRAVFTAIFIKSGILLCRREYYV